MGQNIKREIIDNIVVTMSIYISDQDTLAILDSVISSELYKQPKYPVQYADNLAPFCPVCGSAEYMENPDGNKNNYCGKCGALLDWENMEDVDAVDV